MVEPNISDIGRNSIFEKVVWGNWTWHCQF